MMSLLWYYRPEHVEGGRNSEDLPEELFASKHRLVDRYLDSLIDRQIDRLEHVEGGRNAEDLPEELFASKHRLVDR